MIRNLVAAVIGGLATFLYLLFWNVTKFTDPVPAFAIAGLVSAIGTYLWPFLVGIWFVRRARSRMIEKEVAKQTAGK
jgi:hypothetical protein